MKKLYRWILLAVLFQVCVFSYLEFIYLPNRGVIKATSYEVDNVAVVDKSLKLPSNAENVAVSYNGAYVAFKQVNKLVITDIRRKKQIKSLDRKGGEFTYFRWLPDRDMLIYSVKVPEGKKGQVRILTYDVEAELERSYPKITGLNDGSEISDIELSPLTNVVYTMINTDETHTKVYKFNIMDDLSSIMSTSKKAIFKETLYADNLIYQLDDGKITVRSGKNGRKSYLPIKGEQRLLSVDSDDNIYSGSTDDSGKIIAINYGKIEQNAGDWKKVLLDTPVLKSDIYITPDGGIYKKSTKDLKVYDLKDKSVIDYDGDFLEMLDDYIVSSDNNKLELTAIIKE